MRRSGSPHPGWTLPPRVGRQVHLCHGMPHGAVEESKVRKLPTPSHYRSPTLSQSVRGSCHTPAAVSRWSKICLIDRPRQCVCKHRHDRIPNVSKLPAPSRHRALTPRRLHAPAGAAPSRLRAPLSRAVTNSGATSATGTRYFQAGRPYPHQLPAPPLMQVAMRSAPSTRPSVSIACVASDVHACGRSVYFGRGDAERARI